jgi:hypothetical protein
MGDLGRGSRDLVRNIESKGSIFSIKKKTDGRERSSSMLADEDGDLQPMLVDKDGVNFSNGLGFTWIDLWRQQ